MPEGWFLLVAFVLGIILGLSLSRIVKGPGTGRLEKELEEIKQRVEEWGRYGAAQSQVEEVRRGLDVAQNTLAQVDRSVQMLSSFTQETLHRETSERLKEVLQDLGRLEEAMEKVGTMWSTQAQLGERRHAETMDNVQKVTTTLEGVRTLLEELSQNLRNGREVLAESLGKVQGDLGVVRENLTHLLQQVEVLPGLREAVDRIEEDMGRLLTLLLGRRSGQAGERLVDEILRPVPEEWMERNAKLGDGEVEFALKLPGGYIVPLDSKFVAPEILRDLERHDSDVKRRQELEKHLNVQVQRRAQEVAGRYLKDVRVPGFGIAAVPDTAYSLCRDAIRVVAERHAIVLVPYTLLLPFVLSLYLIAQRLKLSVRAGEITQDLGFIRSMLQDTKKALENMGREVKAVSNRREEALGNIERVLQRINPYLQGDIALPGEQSTPEKE